VGDGPERPPIEAAARRLEQRLPGIAVHFREWQTRAALEELFQFCDLLALPSLWPEPFGRIGLEACSKGIPAVAFRVGGISEWLYDGVNGYLAPGDPPSAEGLADAIVKCLGDQVTYRRLRAGALESSRHYSATQHVASLLEVFSSAVTCDVRASVGAQLQS
jgi:glycosyltransferase involved in cell wall biosynthesis